MTPEPPTAQMSFGPVPETAANFVVTPLATGFQVAPS
jgi:hypothetical protein